MKISNNFFGLKISAAGLSVQRKRMNLISENIANTETTKTDKGTPYQRKFLVVRQEATSLQNSDSFMRDQETDGGILRMNVSSPYHIASTPGANNTEKSPAGMSAEEEKDSKSGDVVYMPEHPDADTDGYVHMPNVNIITEMVDMIAATRSYESNLTAFNSSKQMAKDTLEI
ncbi:MAG: flagellar basal body rod protein FlgC [Ignavibacteriales bacterium]